MFLISSLLKQGVHIKTVPKVHTVNLITDDSHAIIISEGQNDFEYGAIYDDRTSISNIRSNFEKTWNEVDIALGLSTLSYIPLDIDYEVKVGIWYFLMLRYKCVLHKYKEMGKSNYLFLKSVYENIYKFILKDEEKNFFELLIELAKEDSDIDFLKNWDGR